MNQLLLVSYVAVWLLVLLLCLAVLVLARQIGLIQRRVGPLPARTEASGPSLGDRVEPLEAAGLDGRPVMVGGRRERATLLVFLSARCGACKDLAPAMRSLWKSERAWLDLLAVLLGGDEAANREFVSQRALEKIPAVNGDLGERLGVRHPPYAVLIDRDGTVRAKGVVNHLEHLESLLNTLEAGHSTMESWARENPRQGLDGAAPRIIDPPAVTETKGGAHEPQSA